MIYLFRAIVLLLVSAVLSTVLFLALSANPPEARSPEVDAMARVRVPLQVQFMRDFVARVNPSLPVEDPQCAERLPGAIYRFARAHNLDWQRMLTLAWQESSFDCHAKNSQDKGGAYGPFQIRPLWSPVIGDPRPLYFDPELAVERVVGVIQYYRDTGRYQHLVGRGFRNPLLCLYNTGETLQVNMPYCRQVGIKLKEVQDAWREFRTRRQRQARAIAAQTTAG